MLRFQPQHRLGLGQWRAAPPQHGLGRPAGHGARSVTQGVTQQQRVRIDPPGHGARFGHSEAAFDEATGRQVKLAQFGLVAARLVQAEQAARTRGRQAGRALPVELKLLAFLPAQRADVEHRAPGAQAGCLPCSGLQQALGVLRRLLQPHRLGTGQVDARHLAGAAVELRQLVQQGFVARRGLQRRGAALGGRAGPGQRAFGLRRLQPLQLVGGCLGKGPVPHRHHAQRRHGQGPTCSFNGPAHSAAPARGCAGEAGRKRCRSRPAPPAARRDS